MTLEEFYAMPEILTFFPLTFEPGRQRWTNFGVRCNDCHRPVAPTETRGYVVPIIGSATYRTTGRVDGYHVTAEALCKHCERLTPADYKLWSDMTFTGRNRAGEERTYKMRKFTWWERVVAWFRPERFATDSVSKE